MLGIFPNIESDSLFPSEKIFLKKIKIKLYIYYYYMLKIFSISKKFIISVKLAQVTRALSEYCVAREASSSLLLRKGKTLP